MHSLCAGSVTQSCLTPCDPRDCSCQAPLSTEFFRQETRASCYFLLQGSFPDQGSNLCLLHLLHWEADSLPLGHPGGPMYSLQTIFQSLWTPGLCLSVSISNQTLSSPVIFTQWPWASSWRPAEPSWPPSGEATLQCLHWAGIPSQSSHKRVKHPQFLHCVSCCVLFCSVHIVLQWSLWTSFQTVILKKSPNRRLNTQRIPW